MSGARVPGVFNTVLVLLVVVGCTAGWVRAIVGTLRQMSPSLMPVPLRNLWDLAGFLVLPGLGVALVPLLIATFRKSMGSRVRVLLWVAFLIAAAALFAFGVPMGRDSIL